jgi:hypothetical protein
MYKHLNTDNPKLFAAKHHSDQNVLVNLVYQMAKINAHI